MGMTCTAMSAAFLPWGSPSYMAMVGHDPDDVGRVLLEIAYEWPSNWLRTTSALGQFDLEWLHVQRFRSDHILGKGFQPFIEVGPGADPPDVVVRGEGGRIGLECTRLAVAARQSAHGLFRAVRQRVAAVPPEHFAALAGHVVYMWFRQESTLTLPFRKSDEEAAIELVQALADYRPDTATLWVPGDNAMPDPAPVLPLHETSAGATFYCVPLVGSVPDSWLFNVAGFELGLAYTSRHSALDEAARLAKRISEKDRAGSEWLLISAGAPDKLGATYPAEEALAQFLITHGDLHVEPENLKRVTMHFWSTGRAVDLWPETKELFGPLYQGGVPAVRQISTVGQDGSSFASSEEEPK